ncbi:DUF368 domain-containing protein [Tessaracoccus massiliensis]|uniref:DUF368 domain-containing protein n=1 Tax=Tessaracoccus massiliensis TaxID=1522311 RepID=UPI0009E5A10B|nr:DUF368 domain-containing protein [Tessaracoccus massiliensis]
MAHTHHDGDPENSALPQNPSPPHPGADDSPVLQPDTPGRWVSRLLKGIAVGIGAILPGLSGGVLAVIFKLYDPLIRFLANPRRNFLRNVLFFIPIGIGVGLGILGFAVIVEAAFGTYAAQFVCLFIGFVIGTFPSIYHQAGRRGRSPQHLAIMAVSAAAIFALMLIGGRSGELLQVEPSIPAWMGSGALIGLGVIVPGMSPSNFLIYFGLYDKMASGIKALDPGTIIPLAVGLILCVLLFAKAAAWAFDRHYAGMYHFILGMVIGSSVAIFPTVVLPAFTPQGLADAGLSLPAAVAFAAVLLVVGIIASYLFSKVEDRVSDEREALTDAAE